MHDDDAPKHKNKIKAPPWLLTFVDLITLLMAMMALMLSFASTDVVEFRQMMGSVEKAFGVTKTEKGQYMSTMTPEEMKQEAKADKDYEKYKTEKATEKMLEKTMGAAEADGMEVSGGYDGFRVKIDSSFFFESGKATLKNNPQVKDVLSKIAILVRKKQYTCLIEGYTDSTPIRTTQFPSNIHLSAARAETVASYLMMEGVPDNMVEAHGLGSRFLIYDETGKELMDKSRRVEFVFTDLKDTRFDIKERGKE